MKFYALFALAFFCFSLFAFGQDSLEAAPDLQEKPKVELAGVSDVPAAKRPKSPDPQKAAEAEKKDEADSAQKTRETIKFGIDSELSELVQKLIDNDDPRYSGELYDLFKQTKSPAVRDKILDYFTKLEDPCLEDYAVTVLNDPYEERNSTVERVFRYTAAVKTKAAVPAVVALLESDNENYFSPALTTLGEIGGEREAEYLVDYLDRADLTTPQRQALMKVLGKIKAVQTFDSLVEIAKDDGENIFVRCYAAEAIGAMKKQEAIPVLLKLFESPDPNLRCYVIKGISNFDTKEAHDLIVQAIKDSQYKVRLDAIDAAAQIKLKDAVPFLIYRAKNDPEAAVKKKAYEKLAAYEDGDADKFLVGQITEKKTSDTVKRQATEALLKYGKAGRSEIASWAQNLATDDTKKSCRRDVGKLMTKYPDPAFAKACAAYIASGDKDTKSIGLDMYTAGKYSSCQDEIRKIADDKKFGSLQKRAQKILGIEEE
ncbi:MAG: HEAT repeat domain-containing protein [Treponema sp.]|nr:HEAT repeat domain-containing protein [Treponema sp.]